MNRGMIAGLFVAAAIALTGCAAGQYTQTHRWHAAQRDTTRAMKTDDVIALSKAGVSDSLIINMMDATNSWFHLSTQDVINLRNAGVSEKVIAAMLQQPSESAPGASESRIVRYYYFPSWYWDAGFYPYWYYPNFSLRFGYYAHRPFYFHHRR